MYRSGIDVIHHSAGEAGLGIPAAAADLTGELGRELWVIGSEIDERRDVVDVQAERYLTSMWKRWDQALVESVRSYLAGDLKPGVHKLGLASRSVDFARDGGLSMESLIALDAIREDIIAGVIDPVAAQIAAPEWNREVDVHATFVFDGEACKIDTASIELTAGDVVRFEATNSSSQPMGIALGHSEDGVELSPWGRPTSTLVSPGHRGAVAMRLGSGTYVAHCFTPDEVLESVPVTVTYEAECGLAVVGANDPVSVVEAVVAAADESDADRVCSLLADDAELLEDFEGNPVFGGLEITEVITPNDDDVWFQEWVITDIELVDGVVIWSSEYRGLNDVFALVGNRAVVVDGRITRWEWGERPSG
jgi:plastocyanin